MIQRGLRELLLGIEAALSLDHESPGDCRLNRKVARSFGKSPTQAGTKTGVDRHAAVCGP